MNMNNVLPSERARLERTALKDAEMIKGFMKMPLEERAGDSTSRLFELHLKDMARRYDGFGIHATALREAFKNSQSLNEETAMKLFTFLINYVTIQSRRYNPQTTGQASYSLTA